MKIVMFLNGDFFLKDKKEKSPYILLLYYTFHIYLIRQNSQNICIVDLHIQCVSYQKLFSLKMKNLTSNFILNLTLVTKKIP